MDNNAQSCSSRLGHPRLCGGGGFRLASDPAAPEAASGYRLGYKAKRSSNYMVVANTPLATKAGCDVLKGRWRRWTPPWPFAGRARLVEPQSSTIAGSAFMMYYDAANKKVVAYDNREPRRRRHRLLRRSRNPAMPRRPPRAQRAAQRHSIRVPGVMRMLDISPCGTRQTGLGAIV